MVTFILPELKAPPHPSPRLRERVSAGRVRGRHFFFATALMFVLIVHGCVHFHMVGGDRIARERWAARRNTMVIGFVGDLAGQNKLVKAWRAGWASRRGCIRRVSPLVNEYGAAAALSSDLYRLERAENGVPGLEDSCNRTG